MQKNKLQLNEHPLYKQNMIDAGVKVNRFLPLNIFLYLQHRSAFMYIFGTPPGFEIWKIHICLTTPI